MDVKDIFLAQLNTFQENTWFVSLRNAIDGLTEEQANWKPNETNNSIFEEVNHLLFYNQRYLNRFKDIPNERNTDDNTFRNKAALDWNEAVQRLNTIMVEWKNVVEASDSDKLEEFAPELAHLTLHTTYHTGQILYIRKLQGSWNAKDGVKG
ncbi:DinB family protein [Virgibacillus sp. NKC19-3]|uniref:DinB family protein n=1 Tax=Virgibacillus saliphilus TaxID=2831674 RepID=UPI001C9AE8BF|nr:DinB family protein [Virgibacillus sp. NKC19-3]MBY7144825.1 DinB family protein [Virgibacillus sp. NKC19-3]